MPFSSAVSFSHRIGTILLSWNPCRRKKCLDISSGRSVSNVIRTNEPQVWFLAEHLTETTLVREK